MVQNRHSTAPNSFNKACNLIGQCRFLQQSRKVQNPQGLNTQRSLLEMVQQLVKMGRLDIHHVIAAISQLSQVATMWHLKDLVRMLELLNKYLDRYLSQEYFFPDGTKRELLQIQNCNSLKVILLLKLVLFAKTGNDSFKAESKP